MDLWESSCKMRFDLQKSHTHTIVFLPSEKCSNRSFFFRRVKFASNDASFSQNQNFFFLSSPRTFFESLNHQSCHFFGHFFFLICNDRTMKFQLFCVTVWRFDPNMKSWITSSLFSWNLWLDPQSRSICSATPLVEKVCTFAVIQLVLKNVHHLSSFFLLIPNFPGGPNRPPRWIVSPCAGMSFHCCASVIVVVFLRLERLCCL